MALPAHLGPRPLIHFHNHFSQTVGLLGRVISPSQGRYLLKGQHKHKINAYTHKTSMPCVGFEPTIQASEQANTLHALDRAATVTGCVINLLNDERNMCHFLLVPMHEGHAVNCLRHYTTSRKVSGSILDAVIKFFNWPNPSNCTMTLRSTQALTERSTRNIRVG
jgi:hypothetical protein